MCLGYLLLLHERHLGRVLREYVTYVNADRPHQALAQRYPEPAAGLSVLDHHGGPIISVPIVGGLHHAYRRAA